MSITLFIAVYMALCLILAADHLIHHYLIDPEEAFTFLDIKVIRWVFFPAVVPVMICWTCCRIADVVRG